MRHISDVPDPMPSHRQGCYALHHEDVSSVKLLQVAGSQAIRYGIQTAMHVITPPLTMALQRSEPSEG